MKLLKRMRSTSLLLCIFSGVAQGSALPENDLDLFPPSFTSDLTEADFDAIITQVTELYRPVIESHGATLIVMKDWNSKVVNASASQTGNQWYVKMYGGLARDPYMTSDGFALVVCHELGHHLGGFPFAAFNIWAASEGQADYFAAHVCAEDLWQNDLETNATFRDKVTGYAKLQCDAAWTEAKARDLCYRTAVAGFPLSAITSRIYKTPEPSLEKFETKEVDETNLTHPDGQCRLDTAVHGGSCLAAFDLTIIPGKGFGDGQESIGAEEEAAEYSCLRSSDHTVGLRPRCWFKPRL